VTRYAVDEVRSELLAIWGTGRGDRCAVLALLPAAPIQDAIDGLVLSLTSLSEELWRCYTEPASAAGGVEPNAEGWRRDKRREGFQDVVGWIRSPNLPDDHGMLLVSYDPVTEWSHRVGRALHEIADSSLADAVVAEVEMELQAVGRAELGDLTGRSAQAVLLTRADASPVQVMAAEAILAKDPLGGWDLFADVDPTSAAVAAAHWLCAAAEVAAEGASCSAAEVVRESDDIAALPYETPTAVLELLEAGLNPYEAVTVLVRSAMRVAKGFVPDVDQLKDRIDEAEDLLRRHGSDDPDAEADLMTIRLTTLDPTRPARDLLEDLLTGIGGCLEMYRETSYVSEGDDVPDDDYEPDAAEDRSGPNLDDDFRAKVRQRAAQYRERLI